MKGEVDIARTLLQNKKFLKNVNINLQDSEGRCTINLELSTKGMEDTVADLLSIEGIDVPFFMDENG